MRLRDALAAASTVLAVLALAPIAGASTTLDFTSAQDEFLQPFGNPDTQTYGQTITAPANERTLRSFSFELSMPTDVPFRGELYAWDAAGQRPTGPALYESQTRLPSDEGLQRVDFDTGGVAVVPGRQYVAFLTTTKDPGPQETGALAVSSSDPYAGGAFVYANSNGAGFARLLSAPWNDQGSLDGYDASFATSFSPAALVLGSGTIGRAAFTIDVEGTQAAPTGSASVTVDGRTASGSVTCVRSVATRRAVVGLRDTTAGSGGQYYEFYVEDRPGADRVGYLARSTTAPPKGCRSRTPATGYGTRISSGDIVVNAG